MSSWKKGKSLNNGQYIVESILLRGGSSLCYRARDVKRDKLVTLKTTNVSKIMEAERGDLAEKLIKQAQLVAVNCQSPYLVKLYPQVFLEEDQAFMVMDYPEGVDLASYIDNNGKLSSDEALKIITKVASAVNILHQNKCLHLDLNPQNIIIDHKSQNPMIVDYGWAIKLFALAGRKMPLVSNDCFSSPEKMKEDARFGVYSDIYSLAAILYVLTTAQLPLTPNLRSFQNLISPRQFCHEIGELTSEAILKGMALDVKQRPQCLKDWLDLFKETSSETIQEEKPKVIEKTEFIPPPPDETVLQKSTQIITPPTITKPKYNYPNIEEFSFETVNLIEEKKLFGFVSKIEKNLVTKKGQFFVEYLGEGVNLEMVFIPGGDFMMGSSSGERYREKDESPQHKVSINSFYISKYPVTQLQWKTVSYFPKITRNLKQKPSQFRGDGLPVEKVSWFDAQEFCKRLSKYTGRNYRLPTESEWEYACRGNTDTAFSFGDIITSEVANFGDRTSKSEAKNKSSKSEKKTTPVDNFYPNPFGIYDVHGNVWEWCEDSYVNSYTKKPKDGSAHIISMSNQNRVVRGGSWSLSSEYCRSAKRNSYAPDSSYNFIGFRVVCLLD